MVCLIINTCIVRSHIKFKCIFNKRDCCFSSILMLIKNWTHDSDRKKELICTFEKGKHDTYRKLIQFLEWQKKSLYNFFFYIQYISILMLWKISCWNIGVSFIPCLALVMCLGLGAIVVLGVEPQWAWYGYGEQFPLQWLPPGSIQMDLYERESKQMSNLNA